MGRQPERTQSFNDKPYLVTELYSGKVEINLQLMSSLKTPLVPESEADTLGKFKYDGVGTNKVLPRQQLVRQRLSKSKFTEGDSSGLSRAAAVTQDARVLHGTSRNLRLREENTTADPDLVELNAEKSKSIMVWGEILEDKTKLE